MRTLIVSDLHLGSVSRSDVLRRAELREPLLEAVGDVDRVILLGDVLELRHGPPREALAVARPFFEDLGRALAGRELVVIAGNHDYPLLASWLARRDAQEDPERLQVEQLMAAEQASPMLHRLAEWASPAHLTAAYPGMWVRSDVYATHGHYLDCHLTVPTLERLSVGAMGRLLNLPPQELASVEDYETVVAPVYAWRHEVARRVRTGVALNGVGTVHAWRALGGGRAPRAGRAGGDGRAGADTRLDGDGRAGGNGRAGLEGATAATRRLAGGWATASRSLRRRALIGGFTLTVAALNRAGLGPLRADISSGELRRAGLRAMGEVAVRLGLSGAYVVFGHTHRAGPLPGDRQIEWQGQRQGDVAAAGTRLVNAGCWTYDAAFLTSMPGESPYWPGTCVLVEDSGPPVLRRLLSEHSHAQLRPLPA
jgi:predicted phosphodiesterase